MKHFLIKLATLTMLLSVLLCGSVWTVYAETDSSEKATTEASEKKAKSKNYDTGVFTGTAPSGWKYFKVEASEDEDDYDEYAAGIYKGAKKQKDQMITAGIEIRVCLAKDYEENKNQKKLYKNRKNVEFTAGDRTWTGYIGKLNGFKSIVLECEDDDVHWSVTGVMDAYASSFTTKDKDFRKILSSLECDLKAEKEEKKEQKNANAENAEKKEKVHNHNYQYSYSVTPQCYTDGYDVYECSGCGETEIRNYQYAIGHDFVYSYTEEPTCFRNGYDVYICSMCGEVDTSNIRYATDHTYVFQYQKYANCYESGYEAWKCIYCGQEDWRNLDPALGHIFYYGMIDTLYHSIQCVNCGYYNEDVHRMWYTDVCPDCGYSGPVG